MTEKVDPKEYEAAWESVLDCVDGMKEEFSWSKDFIAKMLRELAEKVESQGDSILDCNHFIKLLT